MQAFSPTYHQNNLSDEQRSHALSASLRQLIQQNHAPISFATFMAEALYHPEYGYYQSPHFTLGRLGDFTTAPHISPLFSHCIAQQIIEVFQKTGCNDFLELGPGTGLFAADLIDYLKTTESLPKHYYFYEINTQLRLKQQCLLKERHPDYFKQFCWLETLPPAINGVIFANEVLDAMPVHRFYLKQSQLLEVCVTTKDDTFSWDCIEANDTLAYFINEIPALKARKHDYLSEINLSLDAYVTTLTQLLKNGLLLFADYGYGQPLYYHPERHQGTLMCFHRHQKHDNPLLLPGLQDITAHVDFTRVAESAMQAGGEIAGFTTQANFLLATHLLDLAKNLNNKQTMINEFQMNQAIKTLTLPTEMGEIIKFMGISKNLDFPLLGFQTASRIHELG